MTHDEKRDEHYRQLHEATVLMDYNEAYYRWLHGPEKDLAANKDRLDKLRHKYFSL